MTVSHDPQTSGPRTQGSQIEIINHRCLYVSQIRHNSSTPVHHRNSLFTLKSRLQVPLTLPQSILSNCKMWTHVCPRSRPHPQNPQLSSSKGVQMPSVCPLAYSVSSTSTNSRAPAVHGGAGGSIDFVPTCAVNNRSVVTQPEDTVTRTPCSFQLVKGDTRKTTTTTTQH